MTMETKNKVFIATSLDGYIADKNRGIDWLNNIPNPDNIDMGYAEFISQTDALIMGRNTFKTVCGFDMDWPYQLPVFVLSNTMTRIPDEYRDKAVLVKGNLPDILARLHMKGYHRLYIDGGKAIQSFLEEDLIDELTITTIPVILGGGIPLFAELPQKLEFICVSSKLFLGKVAQNHYVRKRRGL
jgi:dihydrofolate reductase